MSVEMLSADMSQSGLPSIPWAYETIPGMKVWTWATEHFTATIVGDGNKYMWNITRPSSKAEKGPAVEPTQVNRTPAKIFMSRHKRGIPPSMARVAEVNLFTGEGNEVELLKDGGGRNFSETERQIREFVGKSFSETLGYKKWAGDLANTFTISTGERINFTPYIGHLCNISVLDENNEAVKLSGKLYVKNYKLVLEMGQRVFAVKPGHVAAIYSAAVDVVKKENTKRVYVGVVTPGCTGRTGFKFNTVEHSGGKCPIHEE